MNSTYLAVELIDLVYSIEDVINMDAADADKIKEIKNYIKFIKEELDI